MSQEQEQEQARAVETAEAAPGDAAPAAGAGAGAAAEGAPVAAGPGCPVLAALKPRRAHLVPVLSLAAMILCWAAAAALSADPEVLPGPAAVAALAREEAASGALFTHLSATLLRVAAAFALALSVGLAIGMAMGRRPRLDAAADPWLVVALNLPALVVIVLCYIWIGLTETAAILAVAINKIPMVAAIAREGARTFDPALDDMARIHRLSWWARLRHVELPQMAPHAAAAARSGLALVWKIVLVVELLGRPDGVGFMIHMHFQLFDVGRVLVYALAFVAVMLAIEKGAMQPWERRARRWRQ
ncbi:ABC transporter permease [Rhodovulum sp. DZ06]|uniref:ABC transporter permease n=1 Tax=Rhodovulum sp. DZ06 TaxID=3425126 RepID=UPI003D3569F8